MKCPKCNKKIAEGHTRHVHGIYDIQTKKHTQTIEHIDCKNPTKTYDFPKPRCQDCGQELNEVRVGLINMGDWKHRETCPARFQSKACPHCGRDLD